MVYIPTEVFAQIVSQRIERWVARGRALDAVWDDDGVRRVMRFGTRHRMQAVMPCALFGCICGGVLAVEIAGIPLGFWVRMGYAFFMFPVFLVSVWHTLAVYLTTVILSDADVTVRFAFAASKTLEWSNVSSVKYSTLRSAFVLEGAGGSLLRIPAQMDGLRTLCDFFLTRLPTTTIDPSVPIEMAKLI
jgi:hypothetical protein